MNLDYIEIVKRQGNKDKICLDYLEHKATYDSGWERFEMKEVNKIEVWIKDKNELKVKANMSYFLNGHNFFSTIADNINGIQCASELLNANLFNGNVKRFEFGTVINILHSPHDFLFNHIKFEKKLLQPYYKKGTERLTGKVYEDAIRLIKLYDEGQRIKTTLPEAIRSHLSRLYGYDRAKHYIRLENHYKNPEAYFKNRNLCVNDLLQGGFLTLCKKDLITTYKSIMKTGFTELPQNKKDINSGTLPLLVLIEQAVLYGFNPEELLKQKLKSIPEQILSSYDKKARQRQIKVNLNKLHVGTKSSYDITELLVAKKIT